MRKRPLRFADGCLFRCVNLFSFDSALLPIHLVANRGTVPLYCAPWAFGGRQGPLSLEKAICPALRAALAAAGGNQSDFFASPTG